VEDRLVKGVTRFWPVPTMAVGFGVLVVSVVGLFARPQALVAAPLPDPTPIISPAASEASPAPGLGIGHSGLRIAMPELGINLPIVEGDGINAPLYQAAHYPGLGWPGEGARSVIYAHARDGMFGPLFHAAVGQRLEIHRADGSALKYVTAQYYPRWPINDLRWLKPASSEEIVLVTCTTYNLNDPRIIVVAEPVQA